MSFDAFGARRDAINWQDISDSIVSAGFGVFTNPVTTRGFTGHEMADEVGIIHMNGRIYDPKLARFLQADPFVQEPTNTQSLNRYSYVLNNPLNATDPSGYFSFKDVLKIAVVVVLSVVTYGAASAWAAGAMTGTTLGCSMTALTVIPGIVGGIAGGFVAGVSMAAFSGASPSEALRAGFRGGFTGGISGGFGGYAGGFSNTALGVAGKIGASAVGGCAAGKASGGSCNEGAKLAAMTQALKVGLDGLAGEKSSLKTSDGEAVVKPEGQVKVDMLARGENVDVIDSSVDNTGMGVSVSDPQYAYLVGKPISEAKSLLNQVGKNPADILDNLGGAGESGRFMSFISRNVGGVRSASVMHDRAVGVIERSSGLEDTFAGTLFTVGSIPPAFAAQYAAFGAYNYGYYLDSLTEKELKSNEN